MIRTTLATALLLLAAPAAAQEMEAEMTFTRDFQTMRMEATMTMPDEDAADFRSSFDLDEDGEVTQEEYDQVMEFAGSMMEEGFAEDMDFDGLTLDGQPVLGGELDGFEFHGVVGDVDSNEEITAEFAMEVELDPSSGTTHTLVMGGGEEEEEEDDEPMEGEIRIVAPSGYIIDSYTHQTGVSLSNDKTTLTGNVHVLSRASSDENMEIVFKQGTAGGKDSPAAGLFAGLAVLAVAVVLRRRI